MLNNFLDTVKGELRGKLADNTGLESGKLDQSAEVTTDSVREGLTEKASQGQFDDIAALTKPGGESSGFANNLINKTVSNLSAKVGLPKEMATKVAGFAVPFVISKFRDYSSQKGKDDKAGMQDLLGDLTGGSAKDKLGGLGKKFGL